MPPPPYGRVARTWGLLSVPTRRYLRGEIVRGESKILQSLATVGHNVDGSPTPFGAQLAQYGIARGDLGPASWVCAPFTPIDPAIRRLKAIEGAADLLRASVGELPLGKSTFTALLVHKGRLTRLGSGCLHAMASEISALSKAQRRFLLEDTVSAGSTPFLVHGQTSRVARALEEQGLVRMENSFAYYTHYGEALADVWRGIGAYRAKRKDQIVSQGPCIPSRMGA